MRWILRPVAAVMLAALALAGGPERADAKPERPEFVVVSSEDKFEIREYSGSYNKTRHEFATWSSLLQ